MYARFSIFILPVLISVVVAQRPDWNDQIHQMSVLGGRQSEDYRLGPGDLISIGVFGIDELNQKVRVSSSGKISLPYLGRIEVEGLTAEQVEMELSALLKEERLVRDPEVTVFVEEYVSQPVFVLGAVQQPGQYMITKPLRLIDVISMAGGLDLERAAKYAQLQRRHRDTRESMSGAEATGTELPAGQPGSDIIEVDLVALLEEGDLKLNYPVEGGDVVHIPERQLQVYYVIGEVIRPGTYELPSDRPIPLSQALASAGGPQKTAKMSKGLLLRYEGEGERQELAVNFDNILKGKETDLGVRPNDVLFIPGSNIKTLGYGLLNAIPGTISGSVIYGPRRFGY